MSTDLKRACPPEKHRHLRAERLRATMAEPAAMQGEETADLSARHVSGLQTPAL